MFFGIDWVTAFMKILFQIVFSIVTAIPFVIAWNVVAPKYLAFIPQVYQHIPYWHMVAILLVCTFVGEQIQKLVPSIVNIRQENKG